jgi:hypothetical protein
MSPYSSCILEIFEFLDLQQQTRIPFGTSREDKVQGEPLGARRFQKV